MTAMIMLIKENKLSRVSIRALLRPFLWILAGRHNCRNIAISSVTAEQA
jgi:hypothetical protein